MNIPVVLEFELFKTTQTSNHCDVYRFVELSISLAWNVYAKLQVIDSVINLALTYAYVYFIAYMNVCFTMQIATANFRLFIAGCYKN